MQKERSLRVFASNAPIGIQNVTFPKQATNDLDLNIRELCPHRVDTRLQKAIRQFRRLGGAGEPKCSHHCCIDAEHSVFGNPRLPLAIFTIALRT